MSNTLISYQFSNFCTFVFVFMRRRFKNRFFFFISFPFAIGWLYILQQFFINVAIKNDKILRNVCMMHTMKLNWIMRFQLNCIWYIILLYRQSFISLSCGNNSSMNKFVLFLSICLLLDLFYFFHTVVVIMGLCRKKIHFAIHYLVFLNIWHDLSINFTYSTPINQIICLLILN